MKGKLPASLKVLVPLLVEVQMKLIEGHAMGGLSVESGAIKFVEEPKVILEGLGLSSGVAGEAGESSVGSSLVGELSKDEFESLLTQCREAQHRFLASSEVSALLQAEAAEELEPLYPAAYQRTLTFMNELYKAFPRLFSPESLAGLDEQTHSTLDELRSGILPSSTESIIFDATRMMLATALQNMRAAEELGQEAVEKLSQELMDCSLRAHTHFFICLEVATGGLATPNPAVLDELVRQYSFAARLFRQESKRILWSQTDTGRKRRRRVKKLLKSPNSQTTHQSQTSPSQLSLVEERNDELHRELMPLRERVNETIDW